MVKVTDFGKVLGHPDEGYDPESGLVVTRSDFGKTRAHRASPGEFFAAQMHARDLAKLLGQPVPKWAEEKVIPKKCQTKDHPGWLRTDKGIISPPRPVSWEEGREAREERNRRIAEISKRAEEEAKKIKIEATPAGIKSLFEKAFSFPGQAFQKSVYYHAAEMATTEYLFSHGIATSPRSPRVLLFGHPPNSKIRAGIHTYYGIHYDHQNDKLSWWLKDENAKPGKMVLEEGIWPW